MCVSAITISTTGRTSSHSLLAVSIGDSHKNALAAWVFILSVTIGTDTPISPSLKPFLVNINDEVNGREPSRLLRLPQSIGCVAPDNLALNADSRI